MNRVSLIGPMMVGSTSTDRFYLTGVPFLYKWRNLKKDSRRGQYSSQRWVKKNGFSRVSGWQNLIDTNSTTNVKRGGWKSLYLKVLLMDNSIFRVRERFGLPLKRESQTRIKPFKHLGKSRQTLILTAYLYPRQKVSDQWSYDT